MERLAFFLFRVTCFDPSPLVRDDLHRVHVDVVRVLRVIRSCARHRENRLPFHQFQIILSISGECDKINRPADAD